MTINYTSSFVNRFFEAEYLHAAVFDGNLYFSLGESASSSPRLIRLGVDENSAFLTANIPNAREFNGLASFNGRLIGFIAESEFNRSSSDHGFYFSDDGLTWEKSNDLESSSTRFMNFAVGSDRIIAVGLETDPQFQGMGRLFESTDGVRWTGGEFVSRVQESDGALQYSDDLSGFFRIAPYQDDHYQKFLTAGSGGNFELVVTDSIDDDGFPFVAAGAYYRREFFSSLTPTANIRKAGSIGDPLTDLENIPRESFGAIGSSEPGQNVITNFIEFNGILFGRSISRLEYYDINSKEFKSLSVGNRQPSNLGRPAPLVVFSGGLYVTFGSTIYRIEASLAEPPPPLPDPEPTPEPEPEPEPDPEPDPEPEPEPDPVVIGGNTFEDFPTPEVEPVSNPNFPNRNYAQYRGKPNIERWLQINPTIAEKLYRKIEEVRRSYEIDFVGGEALNVIGRIVVLPRAVSAVIETAYTEFGNDGDEFGGDESEFEPIFANTSIDFFDGLFRILIRAKIHKNNSNTTVDSLITAANIIAPSNTCTVIDNGDRSLSLNFSNALSRIEKLILDLFGAQILPIAHGVKFNGYNDGTN
ncbi:DUF2612 domain-containing protein [Sessilibacter corallicola]|uniref:DUF2612 domain-containing protein n=1 Tax=Sessilibacter corallicola TaxID=2904075 RepID=UPI001E528672|nr:DUF2612 domain-containing protein [Sessilibacter corallicola]MCE2029304.1 DUF2612 domain-containing protein [Sessilibacter corallicola]